MHVVINGWFWNRPDTGSGQYVRNCICTLARLAPDVRLTVVAPGDKSQGASHMSQEMPSNCDLRPVPCDLNDWGKLHFEQFTFPRLCR